MSDVREVLEAAWITIFGPVPPSEYDGRAWKRNEPDFSPIWTEYITKQCRFRRFLDAEAYTDAALMLVPEGWQCVIAIFTDGSAEAILTDDRVNPTRLNDIEQMGDTPALAIAQAALAAKGTGDE